MSSEVIEVQFAALQHAAASLSTKADALRGHLAQLSSQLQPLKQTWYSSGSSAGEAAEQAETGLRTAINDVIDVIGQFSVKVNEAHDMQVKMENNNLSLFT